MIFTLTDHAGTHHILYQNITEIWDVNWQDDTLTIILVSGTKVTIVGEQSASFRKLWNYYHLKWWEKILIKFNLIKPKIILREI